MAEPPLTPAELAAVEQALPGILDCRTPPFGQPCVRWCSTTRTEASISAAEYPCRVENLPREIGPLREVTNHLVCSTDPHMHVIYAYPRGRQDSTAARVPQIRSVLHRANARLYRDARASSGGGRPAQYRVLCAHDQDVAIFPVFMPNVDFASLNSVTMGRIIGDVQAAGHNSPGDKYLIFAEVPARRVIQGDEVSIICGEAQIPGGSLPKDGTNPNNGPGPTYAVIYADTTINDGERNGCFNSSLAMHEYGHTMGAVQNDAPFNTGASHCNAFEATDVMCYPDRGPRVTLNSTRCVEEVLQRFDCQFQTYFDTRTESTEPYLDDHWNVGGAENSYLSFSP